MLCRALPFALRPVVAVLSLLILGSTIPLAHTLAVTASTLHASILVAPTLRKMDSRNRIAWECSW
jgi:hypothetical protein